MKLRFTIAALLFFAWNVSAQNQQTMIRCGYDYVMRYYQKADPSFAERYEATFKTHNNLHAKTTAQVYHIPVVFHVLYNNPAQNLPDSVLVNQLKVLNDAYRKRHADTGTLRTIFKPLSADAEIDFYLANKDPQGNPTNGITRDFTTKSSWGDLFALLANGDYTWLENIKTTDSGGINPWPTNKYLNIWVADMSDPVFGPFLMGIATPPINPLPPNWPPDAFPPLKDGVVLQYQTVGNNNPNITDLSSLGYGTAGRTAVHEVGHYLGLRHIWGDPDPGQECTSAGDDGMGDTPAQAQQSDGSTGNCPSASQNTCGVGNAGDLPDMWENYMDYSKDNCQRLFTHNQVAHMRNILSDQRDTLASQSLTSVSIVHTAPQFVIYPQPASNEVMISFGGIIKTVQIRNMLGQEVKAWNGKLPVYDVSDVAAGNYIMIVRDANNAYTKKLSIYH